MWPLVRLRAVQGLTPSEALGFLWALKSMIALLLDGEAPDWLERLESRLERAELMAMDLFFQAKKQQARFSYQA